ncbi:beta-ketoacyl synthase N-terminal-like domain-containing protein [Actinomadura rugatobispora]|uniref:Beta-ketoacyl synthase N-terminal-like domain-containing protein n=1 Tax=Actinomadura rugatobispora TaxID=1994 RepID=A0ABW0ZZH6_9ACTN|nr:hypothetical protein GCM10010200_104450 [Actinomadura rugatobispora]
MTRLAVTGVGRVLPPGDESGWFDVTAELPGRGYGRLPRAVQYLLAAANRAVEDRGGLPDAGRAAAIGTNNACTAMLHAMNRTIIETDAARISPLAAPFFVVSLPAGRLAIELGVRAFSMTLTSPRTAGLDALRTGARALAAGRAGILLAGATEDLLPPEEPGHEHSDEGAVTLVCEDAARVPDGAVVRGYCETAAGFVGPDRPAAPVLERMWASVGGDGSRLPVEAVLDDSPVGERVADWLKERVPGVAIVSAPAGCLTPVERVARTLGDAGVVLTAAAEGNVTLCRVSPPTERNGQ